MQQARRTMPALAVLALAACTASSVVPPGTACETSAFVVRDDFAGARRGACTVTGDDSVRLEIAAEDELVTNPSPWYAFAVEPKRPTTAVIELDYGSWPHRYAPKLSVDGGIWQSMLPGSVETSRNRAVLSVPLSGETVTVAAQELVTVDDVDAWLSGLPAASVSALGRSAEGRPIRKIEAGTGSEGVVLLVGRQHPPEVSGGIAMAAFVEALLADNALATAFRERFGVVAIPMLNPDGVARGHWRHNTGGVDLNRDWGPFTQPETKLVSGLLDALDRDGRRIVLSLDFHSTERSLFYTQPDADPTDPPGFAESWFERVRPRLGDYPFTNEERARSDTPNAKNYLYRRYGIPSMTYEVADEAEREAVRRAAEVFAEEMMRLLLELN